MCVCVCVCVREVCVCVKEVCVCVKEVFVCVKEVYLCVWGGGGGGGRASALEVCFSVCMYVCACSRVCAKKQLARNARTDAVEQAFKHRILYNADRPSQRCDPLTVNAHGNVNEGVFTPNDTTNASPATRLNLTRQNTHFVDGVMGIDI